MSSSPLEGHNNPPAEATFGLHIDDLFALLSATLAGGSVDTDEKEAAIDGLMDDFRAASKDADEARKTEKKPHDDAGKAVQAKWKPVIDKADRGVAECKAALTPYRVEKQRIADEAARKAREAAETAQAAAQAALQQSDDLEARYQAEQDLAQAQRLTAVANKIDRSATGLRTSWEAELTDKTAALRHYLKTQPGEFEALILVLADRDARGARPPVPGVLYHDRKKAA